MIGKLVAFGVVLFLGSFIIGTVVMIAKELIARKRAKTSVEITNTKQKESEESTDL